MEGHRVQDDAGLRPDDGGGRADDRGVDEEGRDHSQRGDGGGFEDDGAEDDSTPGPERAQDGDVAAALVHRVVDAGEDRAGGYEGDEVGHEGEDLVEPADLVEELGHHRVDGPGECKPVALLVIHGVEAEPGLGAAAQLD